ncbi:MAG: hypothetical protein K2M59_02990 [Muribaculaceae bacterium]|nr:hypothetical protein [Muribaculaceae bacterium]
MNTEKINLPASFRVIGVGTGIEEVIKKVKSLGLDSVSAEIAEPPYECIPNDEDKLAIIIFTDLEEMANRIANTFHDAGVLTLGFSEDADPSCYDSVMLCESPNKFPEIIKALLQPIVTPGMISYDFNDLSTILRDSDYFIVKSTSGNGVKEATEKLGAAFNELDFNCVDYLSLHLYYNPNRSTPLSMSEMANLQQLISKLPETVNVLWSVNHDENLNSDEIRLSAILAGKEVCKCQGI